MLESSDKASIMEGHLFALQKPISNVINGGSLKDKETTNPRLCILVV